MRSESGDASCMQVGAQIKIITAERVNDGLVIQFGDGTVVFYTAAQLHELAPEGKLLDEKFDSW